MEYEYLQKIYAFAASNGWSVSNMTVRDRRNRKGSYDYVTLAFVVPYKPPQKDEVTKNEI